MRTSFHEHKHGIHATTTLMARSHDRCRQVSRTGRRVDCNPAKGLRRNVRASGARVESKVRQLHRQVTGAEGRRGEGRTGRHGQVLQEHLRQAERQGTGAGEQGEGRRGEQGRVGPRPTPGGNPFF